VEAASPALLEKVRTVVTDGEGQYKIVSLRPGTYEVTFTLASFTTIKRDGIQLVGGFTATVDAELRVGAVAETLTVTGEAPLVDAQNVRQQRVIEQSALEALPLGQRTIQSYGAITPGFVVPAANRDVGGNQGEAFFYMTIHGSHGSDSTWLQDGMRYTSSEVGGAGRGILLNPANTQEIVLTTANMNAEQELGGVAINAIPKEGGNRFSVNFIANGTSHSFQSNNLSSDITSRGLTSANSVDNIYDVSGSLGGPVMKDKLWFFTAHRYWGNGERIAGGAFNLTQGTPFYTPDLSRVAVRYEHNLSDNLRFTWQASKKHKLNFYIDNQNDCQCRPFSATIAPEAAVAFRFKPAILMQVTDTAPLSERLLLDVGVTYHVCHWDNFAEPEVKPTDISILNASTGFRYNAGTVTSGGVTGYGPHNCGQANERASLSYITGSHAFKVGTFILQGWRNTAMRPNQDIDYTFLGTTPASLTEWATPLSYFEREPMDLGLYVQDQWTLRRFTLNLGLRFDYTTAYASAQTIPANLYLPARSYPEVDNLGDFKDIDPRLGISWNIFGDGKTALKASVGRFVTGIAMDLARANSPVQTVVNNVTRTWNDANGNYVPDCNLSNPLANGECGQISNLAFGQPNPTTFYGSDVLTGFGKRPYNWQGTIEVQHELRPGVSVTGGWYGNWYGNFTGAPSNTNPTGFAVRNAAVNPSDFSPYSVTAPLDPRLPGGGGYAITGLYDISPLKFGQINNQISQAGNFGSPYEHSNFFSVGFNARLPRSATVGGGFDTGRTTWDACYTVDSPQQSTYTAPSSLVAQTVGYCHVVSPFQANSQVKIYGSYPLPYDFLISGTYQNLPGIPDSANYVATNAAIAPSLGRNLGACRGAAVCNGTVTIPLIAPYTMFEDRQNQLDLRLAKSFKFSGMKVQLMVDLYNALNGSAILGTNGTFGSAWLRPTAILDGRLLKLGGQFTF
jgi:hypothetical protein